MWLFRERLSPAPDYKRRRQESSSLYNITSAEPIRVAGTYLVDKQYTFVDLIGGYLWKIRKHKALLPCIRIYSAAKRPADYGSTIEETYWFIKLHSPDMGWISMMVWFNGSVGPIRSLILFTSLLLQCPLRLGSPPPSKDDWLPKTPKVTCSLVYTQGGNIHHSKRKKSTGFELRPRKVHMLKLKPAET